MFQCILLHSSVMFLQAPKNKKGSQPVSTGQRAECRRGRRVMWVWERVRDDLKRRVVSVCLSFKAAQWSCILLYLRQRLRVSGRCTCLIIIYFMTSSLGNELVALTYVMNAQPYTDIPVPAKEKNWKNTSLYYDNVYQFINWQIEQIRRNKTF